MNEQLKMYQCKEGLHSLLRVVGNVDQMLSSGVTNNKNIQEGKQQERITVEVMEKLDQTTNVTKEYSKMIVEVIKVQMIEWKAKAEILKEHMEKMMKLQGVESLQKVEKVKLRHAQLEISKLQQMIKILKLDKQYLCHLAHVMKSYSLTSPIYSTSFKKNHIKWSKEMSFAEHHEKLAGLKLRGEPNPPELLKRRCEIMKRSPTFALTLVEKQKLVVVSY